MRFAGRYMQHSSREKTRAPAVIVDRPHCEALQPRAGGGESERNRLEDILNAGCRGPPASLESACQADKAAP